MIAASSLTPGLGRNLTFSLLDALGRAVVLGDYAQRHFPTEAELAAHYGVSKSVTREALKMLSAKGLVGARPKRGTYIQPQDRWNLFDTDVLRWLRAGRISAALIAQLAELRLGVEPQAAALAARRRAPAALAGIDAALGRIRAAGRGQDDMVDATIAFHSAVLQASGNPFHTRFQTLVAAAISASAHSLSSAASRRKPVTAAAIAAAIAAGKGDAAATAMRRLLGGDVGAN